MHKISSSSMPDEAAADKATTAWWSELKNNGVGESNIFTPDLFHRGYYNKDGGALKPVIHYVAMAKDVTYKLGCVFTNVTMENMHCLSTPTGPGHPVNKPVYQVGEPCKKDSDCRGKFVCSVDEGLCSLS